MKNCTNRKREFRIHEILSNGQHFNMYFKKRKNSEPDGTINGIWTVGLHIGKDRKEANKWYDRKKSKSLKQTGECGLEALVKAKDYLLQFANLLSFHSEIQVGWEDEKRRSAYRRLLKYGFIECDDCYIIRNPEYWAWDKEKS